MRIWLITLAALVLGLAAGIGAAALRLGLAPWDGDPGGKGFTVSSSPGVGSPKVTVDNESYDFGKIDMDQEGSRGFRFTNAGDAALKLELGETSCHCTLSELDNDQLAPGESAVVTLTWSADERPGPYRHTAAVLTNDPDRPRVELTVSGRVMAAIKAVPPELVLGRVSAADTASAEIPIFGFLEQPLEILSVKMSNRATAEYFEVTCHQPLGADKLEEEPDARSGVLLRVVVKPGLPRGPFQQKILLRTGFECAPAIVVPVVGTIASDVSVVGHGWDEREGVLTLGTVDGAVGLRRRLLLIARGPHRKEVKLKLVPGATEPLQVEFGETIEINEGIVTQTPLFIQIPPGSPSANHLGSEHGKLGQILIDTNHPTIPRLSIQVRFAVEQ